MKKMLLTLLNQVPGHNVHLFNNVCKKKKQKKTLYSFIKVCHFFIHVQQNLPNDYAEENQPLFNQSYSDIYLSIIIHILEVSELKFIRESVTDGDK